MVWNLIMRALLIVALDWLWAGDGAARKRRHLADVRQELTVLNVEVQKTAPELSTSGSASVCGYWWIGA